MAECRLDPLTQVNPSSLFDTGRGWLVKDDVPQRQKKDRMVKTCVNCISKNPVT